MFFAQQKCLGIKYSVSFLFCLNYLFFSIIISIYYCPFTTFLLLLTFSLFLSVSLEMLREHHITYFRCPDMERKLYTRCIQFSRSFLFLSPCRTWFILTWCFSFQQCSAWDRRVLPRDRRLRWSTRPNGPYILPRTPSRNCVCSAWLGVLMAFLVWVGKFQELLYLYSCSRMFDNVTAPQFLYRCQLVSCCWAVLVDTQSRIITSWLYKLFFKYEINFSEYKEIFFEN